MTCNQPNDREQSHQQCLQLETELRRVKEERDTALLKMANAQEQVAMQENSIRNLQSVLEQFHSGNFINQNP